MPIIAITLGARLGSRLAGKPLEGRKLRLSVRFRWSINHNCPLHKERISTDGLGIVRVLMSEDVAVRVRATVLLTFLLLIAISLFSALLLQPGIMQFQRRHLASGSAGAAIDLFIFV